VLFKKLLTSVLIGTCAVASAWSQDSAQLGNTAFGEGRFAEAVTHYQQALSGKPTFAVHVNLGHSYMKLERWTEATASYQAAMELDREAVTSDIWLFLGQARYQAGQYREALDAFLEVNSSAANSQTGLWAARCLIELEQWLGAKSTLALHLGRHPQDLEALELLAHVFGQMDDFSGVIDTYRELLNASPDRTPYRIALANALALSSQNQQAIDTLELAWRLDAGAAERVNQLLADLYLAEKMPQEAALCYARFVRASDKPNASDYFRLGMAYFQGKEFTSATEALRKTQQTDPANVEADLYLGHIARAQDDLQKAEHHYKAALRREPTSTEALLALAQLQMGQRRYDQAATHFAKAIALGRKSPQVYYNHVLALLHTPDQARQTEAALKAALAHHPADPPLQQLLDRYVAQLDHNKPPK